MPDTRVFSSATFMRDVTASLVVFLVALPLCLGVALASGAPLFAGLLAGIVGGVVVGVLSGSHVSVSGPAAGMTSIVAAQIVSLGSFEVFLLAVVVAGAIQIVLGLARAGFIAAFFPSSVVKGLLAAIGVILILKQIPHLLGHDTDPEGEMSFLQPDHETTFSEFGELLGDLHPGASVIGLLSVAILVIWDRWPLLRKLPFPPPLVVVVVGIASQLIFRRLGAPWTIEASHLVQVPVADTLEGVFGFLRSPEFSQWKNPAIYTGGLMIAVVASLETLLNLEAVDRLDPRQRTSPPSRELVAQGVGNMIAGMIGGIPITSVIVRSSVNINAGGRTKLATIVHGLLILLCVVLFPKLLNSIPLSCLAAILLVTGIKLASPQLMRQMWNDGRYQFLPFVLTMLSIVLTDLVVGIGIGLVISVAFILNSNLRRPLRRILEKHIGGDVLHIELANQVSFLNRASLDKALNEVPRGGHVLLDASQTNYIDPDVLGMIRDFKQQAGPARDIQVSLRGFRDKYQLEDETQYVDYSTREIQDRLTAAQVLQILQDGNARFRLGQRLTRDYDRQMIATAQGQHPLAVVLSCIDSRIPTELIFDLGLGDVFSIRIAGNVMSPKVLGSMEYGCSVAGAKLILVLGHTRCGAVTAAVNLVGSTEDAARAMACPHLEPIIHDIQESIDAPSLRHIQAASVEHRAEFVDLAARRNVLRSVQQIHEQSATIRNLVSHGRVAVVGAMYDVSTGQIEFLTEDTGLIRSQARGD